MANCKGSRFVYGDLSAWCEKMGWAVTTDSDNANVILKRKSHTVVVALGSASINFGPMVYLLPVSPKTYAGVPFTRRQKVATDWMTASGVVMEKDGRVMVSRDVLDRLNSIELIRFR